MKHSPVSRAARRALTTLALLGFLPALAFAVPPAKGNAAAGKAIYATKCVSCHKPDGTGGVALGANKTPNWTLPAIWADPKRKDRDGYLRSTISDGNIAKGMVPFVKSGQLKPAEVEHVIAHINTLAKPK
ncbi:MAG: cytochrome c [Candidatus Eisenbacteria bacterium]|nr:cytochrome c [Candidatus Eisenbacteria bacterium]